MEKEYFKNKLRNLIQDIYNESLNIIEGLDLDNELKDIKKQNLRFYEMYGESLLYTISLEDCTIDIWIEFKTYLDDYKKHIDEIYINFEIGGATISSENGWTLKLYLTSSESGGTNTSNPYIEKDNFKHDNEKVAKKIKTLKEFGRKIALEWLQRKL